MPELPEVETTRSGISPGLVGQHIRAVIVREHRFRWPIPDTLPALLKNQQVLSVTRRSKYLLIHVSKGIVIIHLGMSGSLRLLHSTRPPEKHDHVDIIMANGCVLRFNDPRRFGCVLYTTDPIERHPLIQHLGPEPLSDDFTSDYFADRCRLRKLPVKNFIMDAKVVVGVGNIYANEALFLSGIHPNRTPDSLSNDEVAALTHNIRTILAQAIKRGGTTLKDFSNADGKPGYFAQELLVYGKKGMPCTACNTTLLEVRLQNRSSVFCPQCQPEAQL